MICSEPEYNPLFSIHRFRIYNLKRSHFFEKENDLKYISLRVFGHPNEFMDLRIYTNDEQQIESVRTYYYSDFDSEMAGYIIMAILKYLSKHNKNISRNLILKTLILCREK